MEAYRSAIMAAFRDRFTAAKLVSYKEVLYDDATEEWYAPYDPKEVEHEERNDSFITLLESTENDYSPMYCFSH